MHEQNAQIIRWGIIGCGAVTENDGGPGLQKTLRSRVDACMRRDRELAEDFAARHGIARAYSSVDALLADAEIDAVYIAAPPATHADLSIKALRAGKPVLVETPMALSVETCDAMAAAAGECDLPLVTAYHRRALPRFERLRTLVQGGSLGEIERITMKSTTGSSAQQGYWSTATGAGITGLDAHILNWLDHAFDASAGSLNLERIIEDGWFRPVAGRDITGLTIHGTKASASTSFVRQAPIIINEGDVRTVHDVRDPMSSHQPFAEQVIAHLLDGAPNPCPPKAARRTAEVIEKLLG